MKRILFICHGNICRSPMAEMVMKHYVKKAGLEKDFYIDSAATDYDEIGNGMHRGTRQILTRYGIPYTDHRARLVTPDDYNGWVHYAAITLMDEAGVKAWNAAPKVVVTALTGVVRAKASEGSATVSDVVAGDRLKYLGVRGAWFRVGFPDGREGFLRRKLAEREEAWRKRIRLTPEAILETAQSMLGFPYIWAGMSPKGMDCSGFVRAVLFLHDIILPRDAGPQSTVGVRIDNQAALAPGDLVFFGRWREDGTPRVSHVGFYLGDGRFIHSMGLVQIGSFKSEDPLYDAFNTGRYLFGTCFLPYIDIHEGINTTLSNPYYAE